MKDDSAPLEAESIPADEPALPPVDLVDWLLFPFFMLCFIGTLFIFDPLQRVSILFGSKYQQRVVIWLNRFLCASLTVVGTRIVYDNSEDLPDDESYIVISNHQSMFDIPILTVLFARHFPRFISKVELAHWIPSVSFNLRNGGSAIIDRSNPRQALPEIQRLGEMTDAEKFASVIFPEGTRARRGKLKEFRPAGISTLLKAAAGARILPVAIDGAWLLASRKTGPLPRGVTVRVRIMAEIDRTGLNTNEIVALAHQRIGEGLAQIRSENGA